MNEQNNFTKSEQWYFHPDERIRILRYCQYNLTFDTDVDYTPKFNNQLTFGAVLYITHVTSIQQIEKQINILKQNNIEKILLYNNYLINQNELERLKNIYNIAIYTPENKLYSKDGIGSIADLDIFYTGLTWAKNENCDLLIKLDCDYSVEFNIKEKLIECIKESDSITYGCTNTELNTFSCKFLVLYVQSWTLNYPISCLNFYISNEITVYLDIWFYELVKTLSGNNKSIKWVIYNNSLDYLHSGFYQLNKE
jgi:hypothetical protein